MKPSKHDIARQFGRMADAYAASIGHAHGPDLGILLRLLEPEPDMIVLDIATGAGHAAAAVAPFVHEVAAIDLAPEMIDRARSLAAARGITNLTAIVMDVEMLEFPDASFDAATCRIAPHHFPDIERALREIARVLRPAARLVLEDSCSPSDKSLDEFLNGIERLRDPTHVRSYNESEWRSMLSSAGMAVTHAEIYRKDHDLADWIDRAGVNESVRASVHAELAGASEAARSHFNIQFEGGRAVRFTDDKLIARAEKIRANR